MRALTVLYVILYWTACCGFYLVASLAFVRVMASLVRIPKGWMRNSVWVLIFTPVRGAVVLVPYLFSLRFITEPNKLVLMVLTSLCFVTSLIPAWLYFRKHRDTIYSVIKQ